MKFLSFIFKRFDVICTVLICAFFVVATISHAQSTPEDCFDATADGSTVALCTTTDGNFVYTFGRIGCALGGPCSNDPVQQKINYQRSLLGQTSRAVTLALNYQPASSVYYLADLGQRAGFAKPAFAQGIGFSGLQPVLFIWKAFRNVSYGFLTLILVAAGFMVMFRTHIDPRTVVTIQNSIPKIIITLLLITFSYAIVGLMIDVMYLVIYASIFAIGAANPAIIKQFSGGAVTNLVGTLFTTGQGSVNAISDFFGLGGNLAIIGGSIGAIVGFLHGGGFASIAKGPTEILGLLGNTAAFGAIGTAAPKIISQVLVLIVMLFMMIRIFFLLLNAWIQIVLSLIFAPLQLMINAIPGVNTFDSWIKNLIANLATFPIVVLMLLIGAMLSAIGQDGAIWQPPGLGGTTGQGIAGLISLGVLMSIPSIVAGAKKALGANAIIKAGPGAVMGPVGSGVGGLLQTGQQIYYINQMTGGGKGSGSGILGWAGKTLGSFFKR